MFANNKPMPYSLLGFVVAMMFRATSVVPRFLHRTSRIADRVRNDGAGLARDVSMMMLDGFIFGLARDPGQMVLHNYFALPCKIVKLNVKSEAS